MYTTKLTNVLEWRLNDQSVASLFLWSRSSSEPVWRRRKESKHPFFVHSCFCLNLCLIAMEKRGAIHLWSIMFCVVYVFLQ